MAINFDDDFVLYDESDGDGGLSPLLFPMFQELPNAQYLGQKGYEGEERQKKSSSGNTNTFDGSSTVSQTQSPSKTAIKSEHSKSNAASRKAPEHKQQSTSSTPRFEAWIPECHGRLDDVWHSTKGEHDLAVLVVIGMKFKLLHVTKYPQLPTMEELPPDTSLNFEHYSYQRPWGACSGMKPYLDILGLGK
ncbi:hypothetical protein PGQ11_010210 [Apiospora arundinis]|uniref:Uncharacterized protein n=1 Tax=Apiospora arundinis TaxID=335852 RepID=A0ABR2I931_9PEZI